MNDEMYISEVKYDRPTDRAEEWLNRNYNDFLKLESARRTLTFIENKLTGGVSQYEIDGTESHDPEKSKFRREEYLLTYSELKKEIEDDELKLLKEIMKTREKIEQLSSSEYIAVATDRYINRLKWPDIAKLEHMSKQKLYIIRTNLLKEMVDILRDII